MKAEIHGAYKDRKYFDYCLIFRDLGPINYLGKFGPKHTNVYKIRTNNDITVIDLNLEVVYHDKYKKIVKSNYCLILGIWDQLFI